MINRPRMELEYVHAESAWSGCERNKKDWSQARRRKDPVVYSVYSVSTTMMQLRPERLAL